MSDTSKPIPRIDIHLHPSLKMYLFGKKLYKRYCTGGAWNPLTMRVDLPKISSSNMNVLVSSIYVPEREMIKDCKILQTLLWAWGIFNKKFKTIRKGDSFATTLMILDHFEKEVNLARNLKKFDVIVAKSVTELEQGLADNKIVFLHAVEGGHSLGGKIEHLKSFYDHGVCMITLAHFYQNEITETVGGIPDDKKIFGCFKGSKEQHGGLSAFGKNMVTEILDRGMIIDLTHCTPNSREEIYELNKSFKRPLVFSHTGVYAKNDKIMNPTDDEIKTIAKLGGVIGVIFMNYWLAKGHKKKGIDLIVDTIKHIKDKGGIDAVAIGSDFDGFTDPPDDIKDISKISHLENALTTAGFSTEDILKILGQNALRVIKTGWLKS